MTYQFRVPLMIVGNHMMDTDSPELVLAEGEPGERVLLKLRTAEPIGKSERLVISGTGFGSREQAQEQGERWIDAQRWSR